jgi:predicted nucleic-acid-binding protein
MISLDTNVIARFYVDDPSDPEAAKQRPLARQVFEDSSALFVPMTVVLELEWVLRAFYDFSSAQFARVMRHMAGLPHMTLERNTEILSALQDHLLGLDFADALHLRCSAHCTSMVTFDDKKFARRAAKLELSPPIQVPST